MDLIQIAIDFHSRQNDCSVNLFIISLSGSGNMVLDLDIRCHHAISCFIKVGNDFKSTEKAGLMFRIVAMIFFRLVTRY